MLTVLTDTGIVISMNQPIVQSAAMASRLISFRVDDELAARLDADLERMKQGTELEGYEISEPEYFRMLFRRALDQRDSEHRKGRKK